MDDVVIFYHVDEFCKQFEQFIQRKYLSGGKQKRARTMNLSLSEVMTIMIKALAQQIC